MKKNNNLDLKYININTKNIHKALVGVFNKEYTIVLLCDDKCIIKIRSLDNPLTLYQKTKAS